MSDSVTAKQSLQSIVDKTELADEIRFSAQEAIRQIGQLEAQLLEAENRIRQSAEHESQVIQSANEEKIRIRAKISAGKVLLENLPRFWGRKRARKQAMNLFDEAIKMSSSTPESGS